MSQRPIFALGLLVALSAAAQNTSTLTARELYYVPTGAVSTKQAPTAAPKKKTAPAKPAESTQIAANTKAGSTKTAPPRKDTSSPGRPPQEYRSDSEIRLVSASYSGPRPLGLRYAVLKRTPDGDWNEVPADAVFHSGDKLRVRIESNEDAYLYIVAKGSSGNWDVLFPSKDINAGDNHVESGEEHVIPNRRGQWTLDERKGEEKLFLVLARKPVNDLDSLIYDLDKKPRPATEAAPAKSDSPTRRPPEGLIFAQATVNDGLINRLRNSMQARDLVFEKIDDQPSLAPNSGSKKETAMYIVEKSGRPDARLVADITIQHD